jgi:hypothetical protein
MAGFCFFLGLRQALTSAGLAISGLLTGTRAAASRSQAINA